MSDKIIIPNETEPNLGKSDSFLEFQENLRLAAKVDKPILIVGERGSGKATAAKTFHSLSKHQAKPFVELFCPAYPQDLLDEELFAAPSNAQQNAPPIGRLGKAQDGILYIHEISLLPRHTQGKLAQYLQTGTVEGAGGSSMNARVVASSCRNLQTETHQDCFSGALLDLLSFEVLIVPPLREREEDIALLANHFAGRMATELGKRQTPEFMEGAMAQLMRYRWPGNIRELRTVVERAVLHSDSPRIAEVEFQPLSSWIPPNEQSYREARRTRAESENSWAEGGEDALGGEMGKISGASGFLGELADMSEISLPRAVRKLEIHFLRRAMKLAHFNQKVAAEALGLSYDQFRGLYRKYADELREGRD